MHVSVNSLQTAGASQFPGTWSGNAHVEHEDDLQY